MERGTEAQKKGTLSILMQFQYGQGKDKEGFLTNGSRFRSRAILCSRNLEVENNLRERNPGRTPLETTRRGKEA